LDNVALQQTIDDTVRGLGLELVELERSAGGLLRVTIDFPWSPGEPSERLVTVEDCERVTRQLQYVLEVEGVDYRRLEVSSPGIDRPLRHALDFERFEGEEVDLVLKAPIGAGRGGSGGRQPQEVSRHAAPGRQRRLADRLARRAGNQARPARQRQARAGARAGAELRAG
jgi:ribosome maturation factor RimP